MNEFQNCKAQNLEKPFPGCLGRVVNLFDLSAGMPGNRLLTYKPHLDGSPLSRSRSDVSGMSPLGDQIEDKVIISELQRTSSRKSHGTPIKMLIAEEMSKEVDLRHKPPNLVAKLMGLDALPLQHQQPYKASQRNHSRGSSRSQSCVSFGSWQEEQEIHQEHNCYKDVYNIWQTNNKYVRDKSPQQERLDGRSIEKKMALVRQNFIELKRLSTDEKLRQSKQFQDALEVLSSNKDSFLEFLQEPNSMFSQQLSDLQSIPLPSETKRITILRPAKMVDSYKFAESGKKNEKQINKITQHDEVTRRDKSNPGYSPPTTCEIEDSQVKATRIVVLKPSPGKSHDTKAAVSPLSSSPKALPVEVSYAEFDDNDAQESTEVNVENTRKMIDNRSGHRRDETLLSSVFSNGYTGDESSFYKSEIEFAAENISDSEVISPNSRHSWDYINRPGSPYSLSSFSRASYSPESSVSREAKKRLSERWAMMASNGIGQEQKLIKRSSSTLGEMLALSDMKKSVLPEEDFNKSQQGVGGSTSCLTSDYDEKCGISSPKNLSRSKSVPASSTAYGVRLDSEVSERNMEKEDINKEATKARSTKSSLKGRVSSLFFSRNNKSSKQKSSKSRDETEYAAMPRDSPGDEVDAYEYGRDIGFKIGESPVLHGSSSKASLSPSLTWEPKEHMFPTKADCDAKKPWPLGNSVDNQEQPSPISVLEPPFQEDDCREPEFSGNFSLLRNGLELPERHVKSNLIDKSPPIGSIARTLSWNDSSAEIATSCPLNSSVVPLGAEEERKELILLVQTLLAAANLNSELQSDTILARWYSEDSPLDPSLRDNYVGLNDKETLHQAKRSQRRLMQKLVFDCVNEALVELAGYWSDPWKSRTHDGLQDHVSIMDCVWTQMDWFCGDLSCVVGEGADRDSLVVEKLLRKEVIGRAWVDNLKMEIDNIRKEIEWKLLEELVQEAVKEFTGCCICKNIQ